MGITIIPKAKLNVKRNYPFMIRLGKKIYNLFYGRFVECDAKGKIKSSKK